MAQEMNNEKNGVNGSVAYDLNTLVREREAQREQESRRIREVEIPHHHSAAQPQRAPRPQPAVRPRGKMSPLVALSMVVLTGMLVALLAGYIQLGEISGVVAEKRAQVQALEREHVALVTEYEKTFDLATVKEMAEAEGMTKPSAGQVEYVELGGPDKAEVYDTGRKGVVEQLLQSLAKTGEAIVEYFR